MSYINPFSWFNAMDFYNCGGYGTPQGFGMFGFNCSNISSPLFDFSCDFGFNPFNSISSLINQNTNYLFTPIQFTPAVFTPIPFTPIPFFTPNTTTIFNQFIEFPDIFSIQNTQSATDNLRADSERTKRVTSDSETNEKTNAEEKAITETETKTETEIKVDKPVQRVSSREQRDNWNTTSNVYGKKFADYVMKYKGKKAKDVDESCVGISWCAQFATVLAKNMYKNLPDDFGSHLSLELKEWALNNNCYRSVNNSDKWNWIKNNVKPGDIMIRDRNGEHGHTGVVIKVEDDGTYWTCDGNYSNKVHYYHHTKKNDCDESMGGTLDGFIRLENFA